MIEISKIYSLIKKLLESLEIEMAQIDEDTEVNKSNKINIKDKISIKKNVVQILSKVVTVIAALEKIDEGAFDDGISEDDMSIIKNFYENFYDPD